MIAGKGRVPFIAAVSVELSGRLIPGPLAGVISFKHIASSSFIKWDVAPLSLFAITTFCLRRGITLFILFVVVVVCKHKSLLLTFNVSLFSPPHLQQKRVVIPQWLPP